MVAWTRGAPRARAASPAARAKLRRALLTTADLTQCDLEGAVLKEADLTGAKLGGIKASVKDLLTAVIDPVLAERLQGKATN